MDAIKKGEDVCGAVMIFFITRGKKVEGDISTTLYSGLQSRDVCGKT